MKFKAGQDDDGRDEAKTGVLIDERDPFSPFFFLPGSLRS